jgi:hypothetical protein
MPNDYSMIDVNGAASDLEGTVDVGLGEGSQCSDTESECSEKELERRECLTSTTVTMVNYRNYLMWFNTHNVFSNEKPTGFVDQD